MTEVVFVRLEGSWSTIYEHDNNRQWKVVLSREAVDWVSIRSVQSLWPHIASVIHESAVQHSDISLHVASTESLGGWGVCNKLHAFCILIQQLHSEVHIMKWS